jgi:hypothetical protein
MRRVQDLFMDIIRDEYAASEAMFRNYKLYENIGELGFDVREETIDFSGTPPYTTKSGFMTEAGTRTIYVE